MNTRDLLEDINVRPVFENGGVRYEPGDLIVALRLPDVDGAIVCIPHGFGGLHRACDFERFQARIRVASDPEDPARTMHPGGVGRQRTDDCIIYLAHHALGCIPTRVNLAGAQAELPNPVQRALFKTRSEVHRASVDMYRSAHSGMLSLQSAVLAAERVGRLQRACNRPRRGLPCDNPAGSKGGPCPACAAGDQ